MHAHLQEKGRVSPRRRPSIIALLVALGAVSGSGAASAAAFPGASGYGSNAEGWRGGQVMAVTTLNDSGPGSLRACAESTGPRVCIFQVAGTVTLTSPIKVRSDVYIAGQSAPGKGVQLKIDGSTHGPFIIKNADDVVIRFLKLRPGTGPKPHLIDAVTLENSQRVYLGNLSMAFATDETFNIHVSSSTVSDVTLADSIVAYGLDKAGHPDGNHSKGALICSFDGTGNQCGRISLIRNLFAHNRDRNPDLKGTEIGPIEVINNVFYDPISQFGEFYSFLGDLRVGYHGNVAITGPSSNSHVTSAVEVIMGPEGNSVEVQAQDNLAFKGNNCPRNVPLPILDATAANSPALQSIQLTITPMPALNTVQAVLGRAGDRLPGAEAPHQDSLDLRVINDVLNCSGSVISSPAEVGGWPVIPAAERYLDRDGDLLPDGWETKRGLNPASPDNPWTLVNGVPAIEAWLALRAGDV